MGTLTGRIAYRIERFSWIRPIEKIEITSETKCFITIRKVDWNKHAYFSKQRKGNDVFDTFDAAKKELIARKVALIEGLKTRLDNEERELNDFAKLEEPK